MPTLTIGEHKVQVSDDFLALSPDQQNAAVEEISKSLGARPAYTGSVLPISRDAQGDVGFDPNAGILGAAIRAFRAPGDAYTGAMPVIGPDGRTTPEANSRASELAGFMASPAPISQRRVAPTVIPSTADLKMAGNAGYTSARNGGVLVPGDAVANAVNGIKDHLYRGEGLGPRVVPKAHGLLDDAIADAASRDPNGPPPVFSLSDLETIRQNLGRLASGPDPQEALAAAIAKRKLEDFRSSLSPSSIVARSATPEELAASNQLYRDARGNWRAAQASNDVSGQLDRAITGIGPVAEASAEVANSGGNLDNRIRQLALSLMRKPKEVSGLLDNELAALRDVYAGGPVRNAARRVGNLMGAGRGLGGMLATGMGATAGTMYGGAEGGLLGTGLGLLAGAVPRGIANMLARRSLNAADETIRMNSPLFRDLQNMMPLEQIDPLQAALAARAAQIPGLLGYPQQQQGGVLGR